MKVTEYRALRKALYDNGYSEEIEWAQNCKPPVDAVAFAREAIFVICNSGMKAAVARGIFNRVMATLEAGESAGAAFNHAGKVGAIDDLWRRRQWFFDAYMARLTDEARLEFLAGIPWIGTIIKWHLAKNLGMDVAKPDRHLERVAKSCGLSVQVMCEKLAKATGDRVATVDLVIWRACAMGIIDSNNYQPGRWP